MLYGCIEESDYEWECFEPEIIRLLDLNNQKIIDIKEKYESDLFWLTVKLNQAWEDGQLLLGQLNKGYYIKILIRCFIEQLWMLNNEKKARPHTSTT